MSMYAHHSATVVAVCGAGICCIWSMRCQDKPADSVQPEPEPEPKGEPGIWSQHVVAIHPPPGPVRYPTGTEVYAQCKPGAGSQGWARAVVIGATDKTVPSFASEVDHADRHTVRVLGGIGPSFKRQQVGMELEVPTARLIMVPTDTRLVITAETADYRRLSRAFATPADFVVDIGCSYGEGTKLIAAQCPHVLGLELVPSVVEQARHRHPHIRFEQLDCLAATRTELIKLCKGCTKVYIDINGTRVLNHVAQIVRLVQQVLHPKLILLKSRPMHRLACEEGGCRADGVLTARERWNTLLEQLAQGKQPRRQQLQTRGCSKSDESMGTKEGRGSSEQCQASAPPAAEATVPRVSRKERRARAKARKRQDHEQHSRRSKTQ